MKKNLFNSATSSFAESIVSVGIVFCLTPFMLENLGFEKYGLWILTTAILGFFSVFLVGLSTTIQRDIAIHIANEDDRSVNTAFSCGIFLFVITGVIASLILIILGLNSQFINADNKEYLSFALPILSITLFSQFFMMPFYGFFSALLRYDIANYIAISCEIIKALLIFLLVPGLQLNGLIIAFMTSEFLSHSTKILYAKKIYPKLHFSLDYISKDELIKLFNFSKYIMADGIALSINTNADPVVINKIFSLASVSLFSVPARLCGHAHRLVASVVNITFPIFSRKFAKKEDMSNTFNTIVNINLAISLFFYLPVLATCGTFLRLWIGEGFLGVNEIVSLLLFAFVCQAYSKPIRDLLLAQGNHQKFVLINLTGSLLNIVCSILFASFMGITGIALGTAIGFFTTDIILYPYLLKKHSNIAIRNVLYKFITTILILFSVGLVTNLMIENLKINDWSEFLLYCAPLGLLSLLISWFTILNRNLRSMMIDVIKKTIHTKIA